MSRERELLKEALGALTGFLAMGWDSLNPLCDKIEAELAKPEAEPFGWVSGSYAFIRNDTKEEGFDIAVYTSPRPMQRLTDDELRKAAKVVGDGTLFLKIGRAIETALIEKNK
jgi:hypothetical protein